jgi:L-2-hydroxyglutarate oxidase
VYYRPGSLKAQLCRRGLDAMYKFCDEEGVPHRRCGKLVVATHADELGRLETLAERSTANGVAFQRLDAAALKEHEPHVTGIAGLWVEETGIVDYATVAAAMARRLLRSGAAVRLGHRVTGIARDGNRIVVETTRGAMRAARLVNCGGLQSDRIARLSGFDPGVRIVPFRGEYYNLRADRAHLVNGLIYPVPDPALPFLGVHFTRGIDGVVEAGPNAVLAFKREGYTWRDFSPRDVADWATFPGFWRMSRAQWRNGLNEARRSLSRRRFLASLQTLLPGLTDADIVAGGSGVRAQAVDRTGKLLDDFHIIEAPGMVHVLNAPSPAATASLAIGRYVAERSMSNGSGG